MRTGSLSLEFAGREARSDGFGATPSAKERTQRPTPLNRQEKGLKVDILGAKRSAKADIIEMENISTREL